MGLAEKKEIITASYMKSFDKDSAYLIGELTDEEKEILDKDKQYQDFLRLLLIQRQNEIMDRLYRLTGSVDEGIARSSLNDYGRIVYPERFGKDLKDSKPIVPPQSGDVINNFIVMTQDEYVAEVADILARSGVFQPGTEKAAPAKTH